MYKGKVLIWKKKRENVHSERGNNRKGVENKNKNTAGKTFANAGVG